MAARIIGGSGLRWDPDGKLSPFLQNSTRLRERGESRLSNFLFQRSRATLTRFLGLAGRSSSDEVLRVHDPAAAKNRVSHSGATFSARSVQLQSVSISGVRNRIE